jgi:hypothetical protein
VVGSSPQFFGANPAEVKSGPRQGSRALAREEDLARALVTSLAPAQRARAVIDPRAPADIVTGSSREAAVLEARGLPWSELDAGQQGLLLSLVQEYASTQAPAVAERRLQRVRSELEGVVFAWMGGLSKGEGHYYRIQGRSFLVEYDNTQNGANHVHSVWREFRGDWGKDLLGEHYRSAPHTTARLSAARAVTPLSHAVPALQPQPTDLCLGGGIPLRATQRIGDEDDDSIRRGRRSGGGVRRPRSRCR